jgi:hypothetical protein
MELFPEPAMPLSQHSAGSSELRTHSQMRSMYCVLVPERHRRSSRHPPVSRLSVTRVRTASSPDVNILVHPACAAVFGRKSLTKVFDIHPSRKLGPKLWKDYVNYCRWGRLRGQRRHTMKLFKHSSISLFKSWIRSASATRLIARRKAFSCARSENLRVTSESELSCLVSTQWV